MYVDSKLMCSRSGNDVQERLSADSFCDSEFVRVFAGNILSKNVASFGGVGRGSHLIMKYVGDGWLLEVGKFQLIKLLLVSIESKL